MMLAGVGWGGAVNIDGGALGGVAFAATGAMLTLPSLKPASCSVRLALPSGCPTKLGIT